MENAIRKIDGFLNAIENASLDNQETEVISESIVLDKSVDKSLRKTINVDSCVLLAYAAESEGGQIIVDSDLEGKTVSTNNVLFTKTRNKKNVARWVAALSELSNQGYVKAINSNIYEVTYSGYNFAEDIIKEFKIDVSNDFEMYLVD